MAILKNGGNQYEGFDPDLTIAKYRFKRGFQDKPEHPVKDFIFKDVLAAPQKALVYGATTLTRGPGKGVYDTPSNVMRKDWGYGDTPGQRAFMKAEDLAMDPLNLLSGKAVRGWQGFKKGIHGGGLLHKGAGYRTVARDLFGKGTNLAYKRKLAKDIGTNALVTGRTMRRKGQVKGYVQDEFNRNNPTNEELISMDTVRKYTNPYNR